MGKVIKGQHQGPYDNRTVLHLYGGDGYTNLHRW